MTKRSATGPKPVVFTGCRPVLPVTDVPASIAHYRDVLGFTDDWRWSDEEGGEARHGAPTFASVTRGHFFLFLARRPAPIQPVEIVVGLQSVEDVDRLYREYQSSGATIEEPPQARPWGTYEMRLRDPDRHLLRMLTNLPGES